MRTINERLSLLIKELGLNNNSFAKAIGVNPVVTFNIIEGRRTKPSFDLLEKIAFTFDNINIYWLIKGEGAMFRTQPSLKQQRIDPSHDAPQNEINLNAVLKNQQKLIEIISTQLEESNALNRELLNRMKEKSNS